MEFTELEEVMVHGRGIGTITNVVYNMIDGKETDEVYCYEMKFDNGDEDIIVYPDEIDE